MKASILIPTYNRSGYLRWLLDYYHKYGKDFDIVIADSSSEENKKLNKEAVLSFPDLNIQYINYPKEINPCYKLIDILNYAKEKYCVFCGDDDFITPNGIKKSVDFLEKNPDFTVVHGYYMGFLLKVKKNGKKQFYWETRYPQESILFSDSRDRLFKHLSECSFPTFYGVHRTDFAKMVYKEILNSKINTVSYGELLLGMIDVIYGKTKCLDVMYMARRIGPRDDYTHRSTAADYIDKSKYDVDFPKFRQCLATHLSKKSQLNIEESKKVIDEAMGEYIERYYTLNLKRFLRNTAEKNKIFNKLYRSVRFVYRLAMGRNLNIRYGFLPEYRDDFDKIRDQVMSNKYV